MTLRSLAGPSAIVLLMTSTSLWADVTPEQVWQGWQDATTAMGNTVKAESTTRNGDTLVVTNISVGDASGGNLTIETISFTDNGDGTVGIELPDTYPITLTLPAAAGDAASTSTELLIDVAMPDATITASGVPEAINYKTDAPTLTLKLNAVNGASAEALNATAEAKLTGLAASSTVQTGTLQTYGQDFSLKSAEITAKGSDPSTGSTFDMTANLADLISKVTFSVPTDIGMTDTAGMLAKGLNLAGSFGFGATSFDVNASDAGKPTQILGGIASGSLNLTVDASKFDYATDTKGVTFKVASPDIPVADASISYGEAGFHLLLPVAKSDKPADFAFLLNLSDLSLSEDIWAQFDPSKGLSHAPATLVLDAKGKATMLQDLMADATEMGMGASGMSEMATPALLNALDLSNVTLKAAGAKVTAQGALTFDNADTTTFSGLPAPTGKIDIKALGVNALIDTLVKMGMVPQDQAMQGRMVLAMFANTSATADEMTSTLEFKDKHFFANGQQLQ